MSERNYYVVCDDGCKFASMTSQQILAAIAEATGNTPTSVDDAFITKIKESNANKNLKFWIGTTAQFEALQTTVADTLYILSDDDTEESLESAIASLQTAITNIVSGATTVGKATNATNATNASNATFAEKDHSGNKFIDYYLHEDSSYEGNAANGVTIYGKCSTYGGSYYLATWKSPGVGGIQGRNVCFGLIWWDGETTTISTVCNRWSTKRYAVKITHVAAATGEYEQGLAKIIQYTDEGVEETLSITGTTLELKNLSEMYRSE